MPRIQRTLSDLTRNGPTLEVRVEPILDVQEVLRAEGQPVPSATLLGMIDTGASGTLVEPNVFKPLNMKPFTFARLRTASTVQPLIRGQYRARIVLAQNIAFEVDVVGGSLIGQHVQCLIGRDILERVVLTYDGPRCRFSIKMPTPVAED